jgi:CheY-like chemotaxis protein
MGKSKDLCLLTVLYVDDDVDIADMFSRRFKSNYPVHQIVHAENGFDALVKTRQLKPDLFLIDLSMPFVGGIELAQEIIRDGNHAPIVFLSDCLDEEAKEMCKRAGAAGFFTKPIDFNSLFYELDDMMLEVFVKRLDKARLLKENRRWRFNS